MEAFYATGNHRYLFLAAISEPQDNTLLMQIQEGYVPDVPEGADGLIGRPILSDEQSAVYEVAFTSYIAYAVRNESYTTADDDEEFAGRLTVTYSKSKFLDLLRRGTFVDDAHPGPATHYGLFCLNHIIDVVSVDGPEVRVLRVGSRPAAEQGVAADTGPEKRAVGGAGAARCSRTWC